MDSKILDAGLGAQPFEKMREEVDGVLARVASQAHAKMLSMGSLTSCLTMIEQLDAHIKEMRIFVAERDRLGDYDASAAAIIELSKVTLQMMEFNLVALRAIISFRIEAG